MLHYIRNKNLPYSVDEVKRIVTSCRTCSECKPQYYSMPAAKLIKATQPFERLNIDSKGPLPSASSNKYLLTVVDEHSRYPFAIPYKNISTPTFIKNLTSIFSMFGMPGIVHSDHGKSFIAQDLKSFLSKQGIATSLATP